MMPLYGLYRCDRGTKDICTKARRISNPTSSSKLDYCTAEYKAAHSFKLL